jgi:hypothetical protein
MNTDSMKVLSTTKADADEPKVFLQLPGQPGSRLPGFSTCDLFESEEGREVLWH